MKISNLKERLQPSGCAQGNQPASLRRRNERFPPLSSSSGPGPAPAPHLLQDPGGRPVRAVEDHVELPALLHLLEQGLRVLAARGQLPDFDLDVVPGGSFDELLQANQT